MGRPNRGTGSAGPKKPNPPINRPQYGNGGKKKQLLMKRLFIVLIKYIPIIQMIGMLFNNIYYIVLAIFILLVIY